MLSIDEPILYIWVICQGTINGEKASALTIGSVVRGMIDYRHGDNNYKFYVLLLEPLIL